MLHRFSNAYMYRVNKYEYFWIRDSGSIEFIDSHKHTMRTAEPSEIPGAIWLAIKLKI